MHGALSPPSPPFLGGPRTGCLPHPCRETLPALRGLLFVTWVFPQEDQRAAAFPGEADPPSPFSPCTAEGPAVLPARVWSVKQGLRKAFQLLRCPTRQQQRADQASRAPTCSRCFGNTAPTPACRALASALSPPQHRRKPQRQMQEVPPSLKEQAGSVCPPEQDQAGLWAGGRRDIPRAHDEKAAWPLAREMSSDSEAPFATCSSHPYSTRVWTEHSPGRGTRMLPRTWLSRGPG